MSDEQLGGDDAQEEPDVEHGRDYSVGIDGRATAKTTGDIKRGDAGSRFSVLLVNEDDEIEGGSGWDSPESVGRAVMVLAETHALDDTLHIEVRQ